MELDNLKNTWQQSGAARLRKEDLQKIIKENRHPVLRKIRKQLLFESSVWVLFMFVYYDFFDGHQKPLYANIILICGSLLLVAHNIYGYLAQKNIIQADNLLESFKKYTSGLRIYRNISVITRVIALVSLLIFFGSVIDMAKVNYWVITAFSFLIILQVTLLLRLWNSRIRQMNGFVQGWGKLPSE